MSDAKAEFQLRYGGTTPYYPQQRYIDENLAPERGVTNTYLEALAAANQEALRNGLMSPKLASKMLPNMLTEGAMTLQGINHWGYADLPKYRAILEKAGLPPTIDEVDKLRANTRSTFDRSLIDAKLSHALMAVKAGIYGEDKAIERWNGQGKIYGADASNHARKVAEAERLLSHPKNKEMVDYWNRMSERYAGTPPQQMTETPPVYTWADENLPALFSPPVNALLGVGSEIKNSLMGAQRSIRNWTSQ
jgi:hypothetical protein